MTNLIPAFHRIRGRGPRVTANPPENWGHRRWYLAERTWTLCQFRSFCATDCTERVLSADIIKIWNSVWFTKAQSSCINPTTMLRQALPLAPKQLPDDMRDSRDLITSHVAFDGNLIKWPTKTPLREVFLAYSSEQRMSLIQPEVGDTLLRSTKGSSSESTSIASLSLLSRAPGQRHQSRKSGKELSHYHELHNLGLVKNVSKE